MSRLALTTLAACLLAGPVLASPGPVATPDAVAAPAPTLIVADCPGKPPVNA